MATADATGTTDALDVRVVGVTNENGGEFYVYVTAEGCDVAALNYEQLAATLVCHLRRAWA